MGKISLSGESIQNGSYDDDGIMLGGRFFHKGLMDKLRARARADHRRISRRRRHPVSAFSRSSYPRPPWIRGEDDEEEILLGFDRMTDDEILYTLDNSPYPEYMGGKLKDWFQRRKTRAKALVKKIKTKYKKLPKWAKILTGVAAAPLALAAAPAIIPKAVPTVATAMIARRAKREKEILAKMTPDQRKAYLKKKAKRLGIAASILVPGFGITTATTAGTALAARKIAQTVKARQQARALQQQAAAVQETAEPAEQTEEAYEQRFETPAAYSQAPAVMQAVSVPQEQAAPGEAPAEEKKGGGLGTLMALGAMALPFILKR